MKKIKIFKTYGSNFAYFLLQESEKFVKTQVGLSIVNKISNKT